IRAIRFDEQPLALIEADRLDIDLGRFGEGSDSQISQREFLLLDSVPKSGGSLTSTSRFVKGNICRKRPWWSLERGAVCWLRAASPRSWRQLAASVRSCWSRSGFQAPGSAI